jgi:hypothetical protein
MLCTACADASAQSLSAPPDSSLALCLDSHLFLFAIGSFAALPESPFKWYHPFLTLNKHDCLYFNLSSFPFCIASYPLIPHVISSSYTFSFDDFPYPFTLAPFGTVTEDDFLREPTSFPLLSDFVLIPSFLPADLANITHQLLIDIFLPLHSISRETYKHLVEDNNIFMRYIAFLFQYCISFSVPTDTDIASDYLTSTLPPSTLFQFYCLAYKSHTIFIYPSPQSSSSYFLSPEQETAFLSYHFHVERLLYLFPEYFNYFRLSSSYITDAIQTNSLPSVNTISSPFPLQSTIAISSFPSFIPLPPLILVDCKQPPPKKDVIQRVFTRYVYSLIQFYFANDGICNSVFPLLVTHKPIIDFTPQDKIQLIIFHEYYFSLPSSLSSFLSLHIYPTTAFPSYLSTTTTYDSFPSTFVPTFMNNTTSSFSLFTHALWNIPPSPPRIHSFHFPSAYFLPNHYLRQLLLIHYALQTQRYFSICQADSFHHSPFFNPNRIHLLSTVSSSLHIAIYHYWVHLKLITPSTSMPTYNASIPPFKFIPGILLHPYSPQSFFSFFHITVTPWSTIPTTCISTSTTTSFIATPISVTPSADGSRTVTIRTSKPAISTRPLVQFRSSSATSPLSHTLSSAELNPHSPPAHLSAEPTYHELDALPLPQRPQFQFPEYALGLRVRMQNLCRLYPIPQHMSASTYRKTIISIFFDEYPDISDPYGWSPPQRLTTLAIDQDISDFTATLSSLLTPPPTYTTITTITTTTTSLSPAIVAAAPTVEPISLPLTTPISTTITSTSLVTTHVPSTSLVSISNLISSFHSLLTSSVPSTHSFDEVKHDIFDLSTQLAFPLLLEQFIQTSVCLLDYQSFVSSLKSSFHEVYSSLSSSVENFAQAAALQNQLSSLTTSFTSLQQQHSQLQQQSSLLYNNFSLLTTKHSELLSHYNHLHSEHNQLLQSFTSLQRERDSLSQQLADLSHKRSFSAISSTTPSIGVFGAPTLLPSTSTSSISRPLFSSIPSTQSSTFSLLPTPITSVITSFTTTTTTSTSTLTSVTSTIPSFLRKYS